MIKNNFILNKEQIEQLLKAGELAPSGANVQPWEVKVIKNKFLITLDPIRSKMSYFLDVDCYASIFSLGCFVENITICASHLELSYQIVIQESKNTADFWVEISFSNSVIKNKNDYLYSAIEKRVTNRRISDGSIVDKNYIKKLTDIFRISRFPIKLSAISSADGKKAIAEIVSGADGIRMTKDQTFEQMISEFRWSEDEVQKTGDGLDLKTLELPANVEKMYRLLKKYPFARNLLSKKTLGDMTKPLMLGCSHICCISTSSKLSPEIMFQAGRLSEQMWLSATRLNLAIQPWTSLIYFIMRLEHLKGKLFSDVEQEEIHNLAKQFRNASNLADSEIPLFMFRLSIARPASAKSLRIGWRKFTSFQSKFNCKSL